MGGGVVQRARGIGGDGDQFASQHDDGPDRHFAGLAAAAAAASAWRIGSGKGIMPPPAPPVRRA